MITDSEVKALMRKYVDGEISLSDLSCRIVPEFWGLDAPEVVLDLDLLLSEVSGGHRTEASLQVELAELVGQARVEPTHFVPVISASHSNSAARVAFEPGQFRGMPHRAEPTVVQGTPA